MPCGLPDPTFRVGRTTRLPPQEATAAWRGGSERRSARRFCTRRRLSCVLVSGVGPDVMAKPDDATAASCWRPTLSGTAAQQALQAVDAIAESITSITAVPGERDPSLGRGQAGLALLYAWLARTRRMPQADVLARQCLDEAIEAVS